MKMVIHTDVELSTLTMGSADSNPVVFIHGLVSGNMATWYSSIAMPLSAHHRVVLYDLRGHGNSTVPKNGFDLNSHVQDLLKVIEHCLPEAKTVSLVGHSLGALIALRFALTYPERIGQLVLIDAPMPAQRWVGSSLVGALTKDALEDWVNKQPFMMQNHRGRRRDRMHQRLESLLLGTTLVSDVLSMGSESDDVLRTFDQSILLIYGRHSPCLEAGYHLQQTLPNVELSLLDCGHYVPIELPHVLCQILDSYLSPIAAPIKEIA